MSNGFLSPRKAARVCAAAFAVEARRLEGARPCRFPFAVVGVDGSMLKMRPLGRRARERVFWAFTNAAAETHLQAHRDDDESTLGHRLLMRLKVLGNAKDDMRDGHWPDCLDDLDGFPWADLVADLAATDHPELSDERAAAFVNAAPSPRYAGRLRRQLLAIAIPLEVRP